MTCPLSALYAPASDCAPWLHLASPPGPRSPRIRSRSTEAYGPVISTEAKWMPDGLQAIEAQQAFQEALLLARRKALISTVRHLRNQMRCSEASICEAELRAVTHAILAQGER